MSTHPADDAARQRVGEVEGVPYLASEFVDGQSLDKLPLPLPPPRVLPIAHGVARGLAAAHKHKVLHRDIKPANIMLTKSGEACQEHRGRVASRRMPPPRSTAGPSPPLNVRVLSGFVVGIVLCLDLGSMLSSVFGLPAAVFSAVVLLALCGCFLRTTLPPSGPAYGAAPTRGLMAAVTAYFACGPISQRDPKPN